MPGISGVVRDLYRLKSAEAHVVDQETYEDSTENFIVATVDAALVAECRDRRGITWSWHRVYRRVRNSIAEFSETLELPELVYPVFGMCLGYRIRSRASSSASGGGCSAPRQLQSCDYRRSEELRSNLFRILVSAYPWQNNTPWSALMAKRLAEPVRSHEGLPEGKGFMGR